jgi:hypothetical protein
MTAITLVLNTFNFNVENTLLKELLTPSMKVLQDKRESKE